MPLDEAGAEPRPSSQAVKAKALLASPENF